jgi:hypothetical protein
MVSFGIEVEESPELFEFVKQTQARFEVEDFVKNPFKGFIKLYKTEPLKAMVLVQARPIYPNAFWVGLVFALGLYIIGGLTLWLIIPGILLIYSGFHTKQFFFFVLKKGLKKKGYKHSLKLLSNDELIEVLYNGTTGII